MNRFRNQRRVLFGAFIIIIGALSLLDNLRVFDAREVLHFWPMAFVALGGLKIFQTRNASGYFVGVALIAAGVILTLQSMGIVAFRWRDWWPVLLIAGGILVISKGIFGRRLARDDRNVRTVVASESYVDAVAVMSGNKKKNDSQDFRGGEITAVMGGIELDLRHASIQADATIHVFAMWGGIVIRVPGDWSVVTNGVPLLGGIEDKTGVAGEPGQAVGHRKLRHHGRRRDQELGAARYMHPILSDVRKLVWYMAAWLLTGVFIAAVLVMADLARWANALFFAVPVSLVYGFVASSAYYVCRSLPFARRHLFLVVAVFGAASIVSGFAWLAICQGWNLIGRTLGEDWTSIVISQHLAVVLFVAGFVFYLLSILAHSIERPTKDSQAALMRNGKQIPISRAGYERIKAVM